jgi:hypothetical protein
VSWDKTESIFSNWVEMGEMQVIKSSNSVLLIISNLVDQRSQELGRLVMLGDLKQLGTLSKMPIREANYVHS